MLGNPSFAVGLGIALATCLTAGCSLLFSTTEQADDVEPLARWRLNEAADGQSIQVLEDDTVDPVDLSLTYSGLSPIWNESSSGRHLTFNSDADLDEENGAFAFAGDSKLGLLHGIRGVTIETKHQWLACGGGDGRIVEITDGTGSDNGWLSVREDVDQEVFAFRLADQGRVSLFGYATPSSKCSDEPHVVHWILDTRAIEAEDRVRVYVDGRQQEVELLIGQAVQRDALLDLGVESERIVSLGRPHEGTRRLSASIWYAAVYDRVLMKEEIQAKATRLLAADDAP